MKPFNRTVHLAPLAFLRMVFGVMMFFALLRSLLKGWVYDLYIAPEFHFSYFGFEWVQPPGQCTYALWGVAMLAAVGVALGYRYRLSIIAFTLSFTYIELMDVAYYLNHYYFISILAFALCWLPAAHYGSLDARFRRVAAADKAPRWVVDVPRILLTLVYLYAGLAKMNSDWLFEALPLKMWLPARYDVPVIGFLADKTWVAYAFAWLGMLYDSTIWIFLWWKKTRLWAYVTVIVFHSLTAIFFPAIGVFPFVMIGLTTVFFNSGFQRVVGRIWPTADSVPEMQWNIPLVKPVLALLLVWQFLFPLRSLLYPGELFWTEEGFRFSWRVMLMEKAGAAEFRVVESETGAFRVVDPGEHLNRTQEKQMAFQPDLILQFAHYLGNHYEKQGMRYPAVYVRSAVTLNARPAQPIIADTVNLMRLKDSWAPKSWITPWQSEIHGW